jgi:hypothetical protein
MIGGASDFLTARGIATGTLAAAAAVESRVGGGGEIRVRSI